MSPAARGDSAFFLARLAEALPSMLAYWDRDLRCRFANRAYERWFGVSADALVGTTLPELLGPALYALNAPRIEAALRGEPQVFERDVPGPGGVLRPSLAHYIPDRRDGKVVGFLVQVTETTALKQAEGALRASEAKYRLLAESSPLGVYGADDLGRCTYANQRWAEMSGLSPQRSLGLGWLRAVHPLDRRRVWEAWRRAVAGGLPFDAELRLRRVDGSVRHVRSRAVPAGPGQTRVGVVEDLTERVQALQQLRAQASFIDVAGRTADVGGWELDLRTMALSYTEQTRRIHGVGADYAPSLEAAMAFYAPGVQPLLRAALQQALERGQPWDLELPSVTADGRAIWVRAVGEVECEGTTPVRLRGALQDITEQRQRRSELQREQALRADIERHAQTLEGLLRERSEMLDVLAHEVRQPLNNASAALQGAAETVAGVGMPEAQRRLGLAQAVLGQVLARVDNTLAAASLLARGQALVRQDADIDTLIAVAVADLPAEDRERVRIVRATATRTASMDMGLMRLALRNLLANALRHAPASAPVTVRLADSDRPLALLIDVEDGGPGVAPPLVLRLFERGATSRRGSGLGLGLHIVRRVMELHGGQALLARNGADGATFRLVLAQEPATAPTG